MVKILVKDLSSLDSRLWLLFITNLKQYSWTIMHAYAYALLVR
jgi:hypothetical protein